MIAALSLLGSVLGPSTSADASVKITQDSGIAGAAQASATAGPDFSQVMSQVSNDAMTDLKTAEATAISGLQGKASVQQVVDAVGQAQQSLQTALAVRDKVVAAYQEISRSAI